MKYSICVLINSYAGFYKVMILYPRITLSMVIVLNPHTQRFGIGSIGPKSIAALFQ